MTSEAIRHSVSVSKVEFTDGTGSKSRPVYILKAEDKQVKVLRITSKFENKSERIQKKYFEIIDWPKVGLRKPS